LQELVPNSAHGAAVLTVITGEELVSVQAVVGKCCLSWDTLEFLLASSIMPEYQVPLCEVRLIDR
jgi:hypothetical protein